jgi:hypothetical protein
MVLRRKQLRRNLVVPATISRDSRAVVMEKDGNGVTLVSGKEKKPVIDPQRVCFPQNGAHDPTRGSSPIFLIDPDGTQVELPVVP